jgi:hypothetical protein
MIGHLGHLFGVLEIVIPHHHQREMWGFGIECFSSALSEFQMQEQRRPGQVCSNSQEHAYTYGVRCDGVSEITPIFYQLFSNTIASICLWLGYSGAPTDRSFAFPFHREFTVR